MNAETRDFNRRWNERFKAERARLKREAEARLGLLRDAESKAKREALKREWEELTAIEEIHFEAEDNHQPEAFKPTQEWADKHDLWGRGARERARREAAARRGRAA